MRIPDPEVPAELAVPILRREVLFLGQCKCEVPERAIDRPKIDEFQAQVLNCLAQYENNIAPPPNRVPSTFYRKNETCFRLYFSTASFGEGARASATANDIILISGTELAHELILSGTAASWLTSNEEFDCVAIRQWAEELV